MTFAYAICSGEGLDVSRVTVTVRYREVNGPTPGTTGQAATVSCGAGDGNLVSGGAAISGGNITTTDFTAPGSQGDHLNASYPSDPTGTPVSDGTTTAASWTAFTHTGGVNSPNTFTDVWALCANNAAIPTPTVKGLADPALHPLMNALSNAIKDDAGNKIMELDPPCAMTAPYQGLSDIDKLDYSTQVNDGCLQFITTFTGPDEAP